jgi:hypothetical protein
MRSIEEFRIKGAILWGEMRGSSISEAKGVECPELAPSLGVIGKG